MTVRILTGDCRALLAQLEPESVQTCVTSPPYWGLRDYGLQPLVWGGDAACAHEWGEEGRRHKGGPHGDGVLLAGGRAVVDAQAAVKDIATGAFCSICGAWRGQLGLEPTPYLFVDHMVEVFRAVHRVLRDDGTLWMNLGDSYAANRGYQVPDTKHRDVGNGKGMNAAAIGAKVKDLLGIPWRVAFALQADGWYLRSDIIWHKPNPMPESVTDRPTKAHEYLFLLTKSERYYYDAEAILEPVSANTHARVSQDVQAQVGSARANGGTRPDRPMKAVIRTPKTINADAGVKNNASFAEATCLLVEQRNKRSVWTVPTHSFKGAHFATFPPALIEPCILAGSKRGDLVLDPFGGAGTTGLVADRLGRDAVLCELNPEYAAMARDRIINDGPLFAEVGT